ncbi:MAG: RNA methyltransferase [Burkholderiales bacterium]|nr:RNA methyltransferase [Burkholderiales bacterium]
MSFVPHSARIRFVLVDTKHPGNIGASARAIETMGFDRLYLACPYLKDYKSHHDAIAYSTNSLHILESSIMTDSLETALEGVNLAFAMTGYSREFGPKIVPLVEACEEAKALLEEKPETEVAFVFGNERNGLTNEQVMMCHQCASIPANPKCSSLNLAQAVQVTAYQAQMTLRGTGLTAACRMFESDPPATVESIEKMYVHLEEALIACGALDPANPKLMMPRLRRMFGRATLTQTEIDILRGVFSFIILNKSSRIGRKKVK